MPTLRPHVRRLVLAVCSGLLAGMASFVFLEVLDRVTSTREAHPWLLWLLPMAGLVIGLAYHLVGGEAARGNALLVDQVHTPSDWVPRRMAPLVLLGTWITHLFGGSAGREGTGLQMSGALSDGMARQLRLGPEDRRVLLLCALAAGFGSVFGVPWAGLVFALEVQAIGWRARAEAAVPVLVAATVGHAVVGALGHHHPARSAVTVDMDLRAAGAVLVAGVAFGLCAAAFVWLTHRVKAAAGRIAWPPLRPVLGGIGIVGLALLFGRDYLGLSLPLLDGSLAGVDPGHLAWLGKLVFTALTLGSGFAGGEVTPLFVIGAAAGATLGTPLGIDPAAGAAIGMVATFGAAANTPLACIVMGIELFGSGATAPLVLGCGVAFLCSGDQGIYAPRRLRLPARGAASGRRRSPDSTR